MEFPGQLGLSLLFIAYAAATTNKFSGFFGDTLVQDILKEKPDLSPLADQWFTQKLNHSDPLSKDTFQQLYYVNDKYYKDGGPVFMYFNGEGPLSSYAVQGGYWANLAEQHSAYMVAHEHRYYGKSVPFGGNVTKLTTEQMRFLSVQQALADAAYFQQQFAKDHKFTTNKWVIIGGSYSGALSAWYRIKYPQLVHMAYSSSGVVHAIDDYKGYFETVLSAINVTDDHEKCFDALSKTTKTILDLASTPDGLAKLGKMFNVCPFCALSPDNKVDFFDALAGPFMSGSQGGGTEYYCSKLLSTDDPLQGWAKLMESGSECLDTTYWALNYTPSWLWQKCTEFGFFKTHDTEYFPGPLPLDHYHPKCVQRFGKSVGTPQTEWINQFYGGDHPKGTRIVYVTGSQDPWTARPNGAGFTQSDDPLQPAIYMDGTHHCADLITPDDKRDPPSLKDARKQVNKYFNDWLSID